VRTAVVEELAEGHGDVDPKELTNMSEVLTNMLPYSLSCTFGMLKVKMHEVICLWFVCLQEETADYVARNMWYPVYSPLVHEK